MKDQKRRKEEEEEELGRMRDGDQIRKEEMENKRRENGKDGR